MKLAIPMASPSTLENRLRALFDSRRSRRSLTARDIWAGGVGAAVIVMLIATLGLRSGIANPRNLSQLALSPQSPHGAVTKYMVTTTSDRGPGSLRQALEEAALTRGATVAFNIPKSDRGFKEGFFSINVNSELPAISANGTIIDGASQTAFTGDSNKVGPEVAISGDLPTTREQGPQGAGVTITAANCAVRSLVINGFASGVRITGRAATGNRVQSCYIGTNATGMSVLVTEAHHATSVLTTPFTTSLGNRIGVEISSGASSNTIGGTSGGARNVISGNLVYQVEINGGGTNSNLIQGNYVGVGADGKTPIPTRSGISLEGGPSKNLIGGTNAGACNVIVGYGRDAFGVRIRRQSHDNMVQGNYIGCDKNGTKPLGDAYHGVILNQDAERNLVGGTVPGARNIVAAHYESAVAITFADSNMVQGNYIGTNAAGTGALGKGSYGMLIYAASSNLVGGTTVGARNVIAGNYRRAVGLMAEAGTPDTTKNVVQGNYIGTDATGSIGVGEHTSGVTLGGVVGNTIGLALDGTGVGNRIAFNKGDGVRVYMYPNTLPTAQNTIRGNLIYANGGPGINLQPVNEADNLATPNDEGDVDAGPNNGQNTPLLTDVGAEGDKVTIVTAIKSTPNTKILVDFYRSAAEGALAEGATAEGAGNEARVSYLGSTSATTNEVGDAAVTFTAAAKAEGSLFTATATNAATGDTSELSAPTKLSQVPLVAAHSSTALP